MGAVKYNYYFSPKCFSTVLLCVCLIIKSANNEQLDFVYVLSLDGWRERLLLNKELNRQLKLIETRQKYDKAH